MASLKQIQANRRNGQKSTGPHSAAGKAASSMNALSSGIDAQATIIRDEDPAAVSALTAEFLAEQRPVTATTGFTRLSRRMDGLTRRFHEPLHELRDRPRRTR